MDVGLGVHDFEVVDLTAKRHVYDCGVLTSSDYHAGLELLFDNLTRTDEKQYNWPGVSNDATVPLDSATALRGMVYQFGACQHPFYKESNATIKR